MVDKCLLLIHDATSFIYKYKLGLNKKLKFFNYQLVFKQFYIKSIDW